MFIKKNIRLLREGYKLTQKELSDLVGLKSHTIIGKYEKGTANPPLEILTKMAVYFNVDLQDLMFTDLETGEKELKRVGEKDRVMRLLEKELDRLEALEKELKETPGALDALRKIAPGLVKKIEQN